LVRPDKEERRKRAQEYAINNFSWDNTIKEVEKIYQKVTKKSYLD